MKMNKTFGWVELIKMNGRGEVFRLNEDNGKIYVSKDSGNKTGVHGSTLTVADVRYMMFKGQNIDQWFLKVFKKWENKFAKENIDKYNELINLPLTIVK
jgi:hypothetical protein